MSSQNQYSTSLPGIAFIGGGNMASAIALGMKDGGVCDADNIKIFVKSEESKQRWQERGFKNTFTGPDDSLRSAGIWILGVKPHMMQSVIEQYRDYLSDDALVISIAAGLTIATLREWLSSNDKPFKRIIRSMPNTPMLAGRGVLGLYADQDVTEKELAQAESIFRPCAHLVRLEKENMIDSITGVSGSGPAYVFLFAEAMIKGAVGMGFEPETAAELVQHTIAGAMELARKSETDVSQLRKNVTSKGGTTAAALDTLNAGHLSEIVIDAMKAARARSIELGRNSEK